MDEVIKIVLKKTEYPDSLDIGTPSKGGNIKVYFNASDKEDAEKRISNAIDLLKKACVLKGDLN